MHSKRLLLFVLAGLLFSLSGIATAQSGQTLSIPSGSGTLSITYPDGWVVEQDEIIILASSQTARDASESGAALPAGELVVTVIPPDLLTEGGMSPTIDPTVAVETMINMGEFLGSVTPYGSNGASAIVRSMDVIYGQLIALGFDSGTVIVLVESGSPPAELATTIDQIAGNISYASGSSSVSDMEDSGGEPSFLWIATEPMGDTTTEEFGNLYDVVVAPDRSLYLLDETHGIWQIDPFDGSVIGQIQPAGLFFADDLDVDPATGNIFIASWPDGSVFVVAPDGEVLHKIGTTGPEEGQFGSFSPRTLVIHNNELYVADSNRNADNTSYSRIQVFDLDGTFLRAIDTTAVTPTEPIFDFLPDGNLIVGGFGAGISIFAPDGTILQSEIGGFDLFSVAMSGMDVGPDGTIYIGSWSDGILIINPNGEIIGRHGTGVASDVPDGYTPSIGEYLSPTGIAVSDDGIVYLTDNFNIKASALTALALNGAIVPPPLEQLQPAEEAALASEIRQWASFATGSSQYGSSSWSFMQATGAPDTNDCGDRGTAWASSSSTGSDILALEFAQAILPTEVNVYQTYNPGSIIRVELTNTDDSTVLAIPNSADPPGNTPCPGVFTLDVSNIDAPVNGVILYFDQSIGGSWNEIDAVELVGTSASGAGETKPTAATSTGAYVSGTFGNLTFEYPNNWLVDADTQGITLASHADALNLGPRDPLPAGQMRIEIATPDMLEALGMTITGPARDLIATLQGMLGSSGPLQEISGMAYSGIQSPLAEGPNVPPGSMLIGLETADGILLMAVRTDSLNAYQDVLAHLINSIIIE